MNRIFTVALALVTVSFAVIYVGIWFLMITQGDAPWTSWNRSFELGGIYVNLYVFLILNAIAVPALWMSGWRTLQLAGILPHHQGVQWASNVLVGTGLSCLLIVMIHFRVWESLSGAPDAGTPTPPSDEKLAYPTLPLPPETEFSWTITAMDGAETDVASLKGKAVFFNIWATWCGFCIYEFPNIQRLYDEFKDDPNVVFLLVSDEDPDTVMAWMEGPGKEWDLPFYTTEKFHDRFRPGGYPTTYFIAPDGRTAFRHSGFVAWDGEKTKTFLRELAAQSQ